MVTGLTRAAWTMSMAGVRHRYPRASERELFLRHAVVILGQDLARAVYPEIDELVDP